MILLITATLTAQSAADDNKTTPTRIISCAPNLTEMLFALGADNRVIGVTRYCQFPSEATELPNYGDLYNPSLEAMVSANPDMIMLLPGNDKVMSYFKDQPQVRLLQTINPDSIYEITETIETVARAIGAEQEARELNKTTRRELEELRSKYANTIRKKVLIVIGRERGTLANLYAAGTETYLTELLKIINAENAVSDKKLGDYPILSREALIKINPDIIIETHHPADTDEQHQEIYKSWQTLPMINAFKNKRIMILTDKHVLVPGPYLERDAKALAKLIHEQNQ